jgi:hypothetical protein
VQATRYLKANPQLKIIHDMHDRFDRPHARFSFVDDTEQLFDSPDDKVTDIFFQVHLRTMQIEAEFEISGKSLDE